MIGFEIHYVTIFERQLGSFIFQQHEPKSLSLYRKIVNDGNIIVVLGWEYVESLDADDVEILNVKCPCEEQLHLLSRRCILNADS